MMNKDFNFRKGSLSLALCCLICGAGMTSAFASTIPASVTQQTRTVTGVVTDSKGEPLLGVNVVVKGTTNGTMTDMDGHFSLPAESNAVLVISYIGFVSQEVPANKQLIKIALKEDTQNLDEVVVTALGITRSEKALGYATQKFDGEELTRVKGVNIATSLSGRISGLRVYNSTEFGVAPNIKLRGESPLIVVDGVPTNQAFSDFNQDVIENITVLKGATASALYGSRGGNGAIMITTKKGNGKGFKVEVNTSN
ncbi:MAG: carboxypeptidase-like regulatory domain-containing protein, partial [Parabacteroides sp.]|nr:carboxypeptidase-like regulatory domain-containing protein [Parabacteroides sp.]